MHNKNAGHIISTCEEIMVNECIKEQLMDAEVVRLVHTNLLHQLTLSNYGFPFSYLAYTR